MTRRWVSATAVFMLAGITGCVDRHYVIESDPPGALVLVNGQPLGSTPVDGHFVYYGNYTFTLIKDGFQTKQVDQRISPPFYEWPVIDFVSENLYPGQLVDTRRFRYSMEPLVQVDVSTLLREAEALRGRGKTIGDQ